MESVEDTLAELEVDHLPVVIALNKVDLIADGEDGLQVGYGERTTVPISALTGQNVETLLMAVEAVMERYLKSLEVFLPYERGDLMSLFYDRGQVVEEKHEAEGMRLSGQIPGRLLPYFAPYVVNGEEA